MNRLLTKIEMLEAMARRHLRRLEPAPKPVRVPAAAVPVNSKAGTTVRPQQGWGLPR